MQNQNAIHCQECGSSLPETARFCVDCGTPLTQGTDDIHDIHTVSGIETDPNVEPKHAGDANSPNARTSPLKTGDIVAEKFEIERQIGQGGMGAVYKATELLTGNPAALKVISPRRQLTEAETKRLIDEGVTARQINHQNIVQIHDIGLHRGAPYIAMEYIEGKPLHIWRTEKMSQGHSVSMQVASNIIREILNGLEAAHARGVIHRDLKPENIMLIGEPSETAASVKIVDFGIALAKNGASHSSTGTGLGSQHYMAPEQIRNANNANASADLYALSKIFYELIVGVIPTGHWQPPSGGRADVPKGIDALIEKGLSVNRDMRPQSATEYRASLDAAFRTPIWNTDQSSREDRKEELEKIRQDMKDVYLRLFKNTPRWVWIVTGLIVVGSIISELHSALNGYDGY